MSNTNLPRVPTPEPSVFSPGHWLILIAALLMIFGVAGFHALSKPAHPASAGDLRETQAQR
jgi:hypothetical protein